MNNKKIVYSVILIILIVLGIIIYKLNLTKNVNKEGPVKISEVRGGTDSAVIVSLLRTTAVSPTSSMISWKTDQNTTTELYYGTTTISNASNKFVIKDKSSILYHTVEITHLIPATKYYFYIVSINPENMAKSITVGEFITTAH